MNGLRFLRPQCKNRLSNKLRVCKEHISRCEKQTHEVAKKVDSLEIKIQADATETQRQVNRLDASIVETRSNIDSNKESVLQTLSDEILKVRQGVRRRSAPNTVSYTHLSDNCMSGGTGT